MKLCVDLFIFWIALGTSAPAQLPKNPNLATSQQAKPRPAPEVIIDSPPDVPLKASLNTRWVEMDARGIELDITVENVSNKAVRAYTTRNAIEGDTTSDGCFLMNIIKPGKVLQPGQKELRTTWRGYTVGASPPIHLTVDFVEFTDNSTWGADTCQSAERLDGQRSGARAATQALLKTLDESGPEEVLKALRKLPRDLVVPSVRSLVWQEGFRGAVQHVVDMVRAVNQSDGLPEIGPALKKPYDASGYKIEVIPKKLP